MREIKFRAWDIAEKVMCEVQVINLTKGAKLAGNSPSMHNISMNMVIFGPEDGHFVDFDGIHLMQFTGLRDKNGKEIYEGDVVKVLDRDWSDMEKDTRIYIVYYADDSFVLTTQAGIQERESDNPNQYNKDWLEARLHRSYGRDRFEIIGNIHQHPELLK